MVTRKQIKDPALEIPVPPIAPIAEIAIRLERLINEAIELNRLNRQVVTELWSSKAVKPDWYLENYGTVHINVGSRTGKTHWIVTNAKENDLVISPYAKALSLQPVRTKAKVVDIRNYRTSQSQDQRFSRVFIDDPVFCFSIVEQREIYRNLSYDTDQLFVLLGQ